MSLLHRSIVPTEIRKCGTIDPQFISVLLAIPCSCTNIFNFNYSRLCLMVINQYQYIIQQLVDISKSISSWYTLSLRLKHGSYHQGTPICNIHIFFYVIGLKLIIKSKDRYSVDIVSTTSNLKIVCLIANSTLKFHFSPIFTNHWPIY